MTILERFEGGFAVIEKDGKLFTIEKKFVDKTVKAGDLLTQKGNIYYPDSDKTKARRQKIAELEDSLFE